MWLEKRPQTGVWAGLYCLPAFESIDALEAALPARVQARAGEPFVHVLTHKDLHLHPVVAQLDGAAPTADEGGWFGADAWPALGLPAPVRKLLEAA